MASRYAPPPPPSSPTPAAPSARFDQALPRHPADPRRRSRRPMPRRQRRWPMTSAYHLDAGDKLRVVVYGQEGLTNTYAIGAGGSITMPLIGSVPARGRTPAGLAAEIAARLRNGFIREPSVAVEIEAYRPFFILGEVAAPGQYPYVPNMTRRKRGGDRRRLLAARPPRPRHAHPHRRLGPDANRGAARHGDRPRRYRAGRRTLVLDFTSGSGFDLLRPSGARLVAQGKRAKDAANRGYCHIQLRPQSPFQPAKRPLRNCK